MPYQSSSPGSHHYFMNLSVKDLLEARDMFHVHLMNKKNVVATAIGRSLIRKSDLRNGQYHPRKTFPRKARTLDSSVVCDFSWPCVLVFIEEWMDESRLINS